VKINLSLVDETKIVTAASELARNMLTYGGGGEVTLEVLQEGVRHGLRVHFVDDGPGTVIEESQIGSASGNWYFGLKRRWRAGFIRRCSNTLSKFRQTCTLRLGSWL
jgi:anti-sigma regulatory factor (Ser/Thr protein kinase)